MIHFAIPWDDNKNIGQSYNRTMNMVGENDWVCFIDGDAMFLDPFFGRKLQEVIDANTEYGVFTCMASRIGCEWQRSEKIGAWYSHEITDHRKWAKEHWNEFGTECENVLNKPKGKVLGGVLILINKKTWRKVEGFREDGMLGIDNQLHWDCQDKNLPVGLMKGVYVYHYYRGKDITDKSHLR